MSVSPTSPFTTQRATLSASGSSDDVSAPGDLSYVWDFGNGGSRTDARGRVVRTRFGSAGPRTVQLTVTDEAGNRRTIHRTVTARRFVQCGSGEVTRSGSWRSVSDRRADGGRYCDNLGRARGTDVMRFSFNGPQVTIARGASQRGGWAMVFVDGRRKGDISFRDGARTVHFGVRTYRGLGEGRHTIRVVVQRRQAYIDGFIVYR